MYTILVCSDNSLMTTKRERIMQRSKLTDNLQILVPKLYNKENMSDYTVQLEYVLPCSKRYCTEILELSDEMYNEDHLKYVLPFDTKLTSESGEIEVQLTFAKTDLDEYGNGIQRVRKTSTTKVNIVPISAWSDIIPDSALSAIDERLIKLDAQMRGLAELADAFGDGEVTGMVDNLVYDETDDTLQLSSNGVGVGDKVSIKDMLDDGAPAVDFDSNSGGNSGSGDDSTTDDETSDRNFVEF